MGFPLFLLIISISLTSVIMEKEIWKDIDGYDGYQASNLGNIREVKILHDLKVMPNYIKKRLAYTKYRIVNQKVGSHGYLKSSLLGYGSAYVHRLVAMAFHPLDSYEGLEVNHKDEDKANNRVDNLEWVTHKENMNYGTRTQRCSKEVYQYTLDGEFVTKYASTRDAGRNTGINYSLIARCCRGNCGNKTIHGYVWRYKPIDK